MCTDPIRILLLDDNENEYVITRDILEDIEHQKYEITWKSTCDSALEALERESYQACLVDYRLGEHNGIQFIERALHAGFPLPIILLTSHNDREVDMPAMEAGAADYLNKGPITPDLLERSIR